MTNNTSTELVEALDKVGISFGDLKNLSQEQFDKILEMTKKKELSKIESNLILGALPSLVEYNKNTIDGIKSITNNAKEAQQAALSGIETSCNTNKNVLDNLSKDAQSDKLKNNLAKSYVKASDNDVKKGKNYTRSQ